MTVKLVGSTSGSVSLQAPASTTGGAHRTLTLPDKNGTVATTSDSFGKILQVIQNVKTDIASWSGTSFSNVGGTDESGNGTIWEVNITPTKANSKILVEFSGVFGGNHGVMMAVRLVREIQDANAAYPFLGDSRGVRPRLSRQVRDDQTAMKAHAIHQAHFSYLDSPSYSVGNKLTYHLEGKCYSSSSYVYLNSAHGDQNNADYDACQASTLTVMEVAA